MPVSSLAAFSPLSARAVADCAFAVLARGQAAYAGRAYPLSGPQALHFEEVTRALVSGAGGEEGGGCTFDPCTEKENVETLTACGVPSDAILALANLFRILNSPSKYYILNDVQLELDPTIVNETLWSFCESLSQSNNKKN